MIEATTRERHVVLIYEAPPRNLSRSSAACARHPEALAEAPPHRWYRCRGAAHPSLPPRGARLVLWAGDDAGGVVHLCGLRKSLTRQQASSKASLKPMLCMGPFAGWVSQMTPILWPRPTKASSLTPPSKIPELVSWFYLVLPCLTYMTSYSASLVCVPL